MLITLAAGAGAAGAPAAARGAAGGPVRPRAGLHHRLGQAGAGLHRPHAQRPDEAAAEHLDRGQYSWK